MGYPTNRVLLSGHLYHSGCVIDIWLFRPTISTVHGFHWHSAKLPPLKGSHFHEQWKISRKPRILTALTDCRKEIQFSELSSDSFPILERWSRKTQFYKSTGDKPTAVTKAAQTQSLPVPKARSHHQGVSVCVCVWLWGRICPSPSQMSLLAWD